MFFYLSFLRPPPLDAALGEPVSVTPQIANDLRTELFQRELDIFYFWLPVSASGAPSQPQTAPKKLTTWRPASAYKETPLAPPPNVRAGDRWRLSLFVPPVRAISLPGIDADADADCPPFPVLSMPITFHLRLDQKRKSIKQEQIERVFHLHPSQPLALAAVRLPPLLVREQTSFDLDKKVWDSGIGLSAWIVDFQTSSTLQNLHTLLFPPRTREANIIELGSGNGIVSITLAALPCSGIRNIIATDLPSAMELLEHNVQTNHARSAANAQPATTTSAPPRKTRTAVLDWNDPLPQDVLDVPGGFDLIVMADVTYNTSSFPALLRTLRALLDLRPSLPAPSSPSPSAPSPDLPTSNSDSYSDTRPPPLILLAYKQRDPAERALFSSAESELGVRFERVGERVGAGEPEVEVYLGGAGRAADS